MESPRESALFSDAQRQTAVQETRITDMLDAAARIEAFHLRENTGIALNTGLSEPELEKAFGLSGCIIPDDLRALWGWRNGEQSERFIWYHRFLPAVEALAHYRALTSNPLYQWSDRWIPVFEFEGEWYGVECRDQPVAAGPVVHYFIEDEPRYAYINLTTYLEVIALAIERDALRWQDDWWQDESRQLAAIHADLNPGVAFPYYVEP